MTEYYRYSEKEGEKERGLRWRVKNGDGTRGQGRERSGGEMVAESDGRKTQERENRREVVEKRMMAENDDKERGILREVGGDGRGQELEEEAATKKGEGRKEERREGTERGRKDTRRRKGKMEKKTESH